MSYILYYSRFCNYCKPLLQYLSTKNYSNQIHFLCIDKRIQKGKDIFIILENGSEVVLPSTIDEVPALVLVNHGSRLIKGTQSIMNYLKELDLKHQNNQDLQAFDFNTMNSMSDSFSYLDSTPEDLSAKTGNAGLRTLGNFATINHRNLIETPPEDYVPNKIKEMDLGKLQQERETDIKIPR